MTSKTEKNPPHCRNNSENQYQVHFKEGNSIPLTHKYMTAYFPGLVQLLQIKVAGLN